jgi:uncharacterized protein YbaP (TraB family)
MTGVILVSCNVTKTALPDKPDLGKTTTAYTPSADALLWKIEGKGKTNVSYLFGTIHIIDADDFFWPDGTLSAIEKANQMVFEIDMDVMSDFSAQMALMPEIFMKGNKSLDDYLSEEDYEIVKSHFSEKGMPMFMVRRMKPMVASAMSELDLSSLDMSMSEMKSYEFEFYDLARQRDMDVDGLETMDYQIGLFDSIPYADQAKMLVESITTTADDEMLEQTIEMYKAQDIEGLYDMMGAEDERFQEVLLFRRNANWIPIMEKMMVENSVFFAVGAGHLGGQKGVIELLRQAGYTLSPLSL